MTSSTTGSTPQDYSCDHFPNQPISDAEMVAHYRALVGDHVVNEQIATRGPKAVVESMQRQHRAHLVAATLSPAELHRRAEILESLMDELGTPAVGSAPDVASDLGRVLLFADAVRELVDRVTESK